MRKILLLCLIILGLQTIVSAQRLLSEDAKISVITCAPYEGEVFTVYGHAAFRVQDPEQKLDLAFNYGIFDFSAPNFVFRFALGKTDYILGAYNYQHYISEYRLRGSDVTEQVLDLTKEDKNMIWMALLENAKEENRVYRYNFFFDNCATRLPAILEEYINGEIVYHKQPTPKTFREMINHCTRNQPWLTFGCDIALGSPTDRLATAHEMMFLPFYLKEALENASIYGFDETERSLVAETNMIKAMEVEDQNHNLFNTILTPLVCSWILFALILGATIYGYKKKRVFAGIDISLFTIAGIGGLVLFFLCFISEHPCIWPNWSLIWLNPLHLFAVILFCVKRWKKAAYYYHFINFAALLCMLIGWYFIPQHMNMAFIPLVASLWLRSGYRIYCYRQDIG